MAWDLEYRNKFDCLQVIHEMLIIRDFKITLNAKLFTWYHKHLLENVYYISSTYLYSHRYKTVIFTLIMMSETSKPRTALIFLLMFILCLFPIFSSLYGLSRHCFRTSRNKIMTSKATFRSDIWKRDSFCMPEAQMFYHFQRY